MTNESVRPPELFAWNDHTFRLFVESVKDYAIFMLDAQGRVVTWNAGAQRIKGYRPEEILGAHFSRFYLPEDVAQDKPAHELEIACRLGRFEDEGWRVRKDGSRFLANVLLTPLRDPEGRLYGFGKITRDVTGRRTAEAQVFELAEELRRAKEADLDRMNQLRLKDEFLCHVSHEFRAPLASIYSFTTLIADRLAGATTPKQDEYLAIILKNIRQLQAMIEDLLEAPQAVDGTLKVEAQFTPLADAIEYAVQTLSSAARAKAIRLSAALAPQLPLACADAMRLRQVLAILLDNAIKFTALGGAVSVRAGRFDQSSDFLLVEVTDTGCGIAPEDLERIFERLYQAGGEDCEGQRGLGLGLYIARELVSRMGGQIWATSELQRGSCFYFTLPVFSLAEWIAPALEQQTGRGDAIFLDSIRVTLPAPSLALTGELRQEIRRRVASCLRSGAEVLLPEMCPRGPRNLLFVVASSPREGGEELEKLIRAAFEGSAALRAAGVGCAVSSSVVPAPPIQELSSPQAVQARLSAEIQIRVNHLCAQGGTQA